MVFDALTGLVDALNQVVAPPDDVDSEGEHYRNFRSILPVGYHTLKAAKVEHDVLYRRIELILDFCEKVEHHLRARVDDPESRLQDDVVFLIVNRRYVEDIQCRLPDCPSIPIYRDYATTMDQVATAAMGLDTGLILRKAREDRSDVSSGLTQSFALLSSLRDPYARLLSDLKIERRAILDALDEASDRRRKTGEAVRKPAVSAKPSKKRGRKQAKDDECENDVMALYEKRQGSPNVYYSIADDLKSKYPGMTPKQAEKIKRRVMGRRERAKGVTKSRVRPRRNS